MRLHLAVVNLRCGTRARLVFALALLTAAFCEGQARQSAITGSLTYRERIALPSDAAIDVQLVDTSVADLATQTVAESIFNAEGRQVPIPFTLTYDPAQIVSAHRYSVRATIRSADGMLLFSTTQAYPVLTHGEPSKVELVLHTVGHGAKPGTAAKEPTPALDAHNAAPTASQAATVTKTAGAAPPTPSSHDNEVEVTSPSTAASVSVPTSGGPATTREEAGVSHEPTSTATNPNPPSSEADHGKSEPPSSSSEPSASAAAQASKPEALPDSPSTTRVAAPEGTSESAGTMPDTGESERQPSAANSDRPLSPLADTQWRLLEIGGVEVVTAPPDRPLTLAFSPEGARIAGSAGCNSYRGTFSDYAGLLHLNPASLTMIGCAELAAERQQKFVAMLRSADGYRIEDNILVLTNGGKIVAKFRNIGE